MKSGLSELELWFAKAKPEVMDLKNFFCFGNFVVYI